MSRFESAPWPLKALYLSAAGALATTACACLLVLVALAGLHRLNAHLDLEVAAAWLWYFRGDPDVRRWLAVGTFVDLLLLGSGAVQIAKGLKPPLHGAAHWAHESQLRRQDLRASHGVILGRKDGRLLRLGGSEHVALYAPTRSGKGVGVVIPNLLTWPDSLVVLDIKRENWAASSGYRAAHGQSVILFDPLDPEGRTARFNPLGHIDRKDVVAVLDELQKLAVMLFPLPPSAEPFWSEAARTAFVGVGAYVAETPPLRFSLGTIYRQLTDGDPKARFSKILKSRQRVGPPLSQGCASALSDFCAASDNTFASIKQTITARMNLWLNPRICAATDASDFDLQTLRDRRMSLYLAVSPDNLLRVAPLYSLLLQLLVDLNTRELPTSKRHTIPVLIVLDEFARLGHASVVAHAFSYVAGYGLRFLLVLQSQAQLRGEYGPDLAEEIIANCGVEIAFAPKELRTAQDLSGRLGAWTYPSVSSSRPEGFSKGHRTRTTSDQRRPLMLPQELIEMSPKRLIILRAGSAPVLGEKIVYWREHAFRRRILPPPSVAPLAVVETTDILDGRPSTTSSDETIRLSVGARAGAGGEDRAAAGVRRHGTRRRGLDAPLHRRAS